MSSTQNGDHEWSDKELKAVLKYFLRHVVGIALTYRCRIKDGKLSADGELEGEDQFCCFSAFVISIRDKWWLVTAGHIINNWKPAIESGAVLVVGQSLSHYFGIGAKCFEPLPYNLMAQPIMHVYDLDRSLDFALIPIDDWYKDRLEENGILPLPINWQRRGDYEGFYGYGIVGFPDEYSNPLDVHSESKTAGEVRPVLVPVSRQQVQTPKGHLPEFVADVLDMGNQKQIDGMSGGPIFGFCEGKNGTEYEIVAIQSMCSDNGLIIGCPLHVVFSVIAAALEHRGD